MAHHNLLSNKNKKKELARIYEEFEVYKGLKPTTKSKKVFKKLYKDIQARLISEGKFPNKQARDLNRAILKEIGEFPYWAHGGTIKQNNAAVEFGQGIVHRMSGGEARPFFLRDASNELADAIRLQRTNWANDIMSAAGYETEVIEGKKIFKGGKNRVRGKAWDHTYELQEFGPRYKAILEEFASGSINPTQFKRKIAQEISKFPGDITRNLKLLDEADNYAKRAIVEKEVKTFQKSEAYKVRDAKYHEFQNLDDVSKELKLKKAHETAVDFTKNLHIEGITKNSKLLTPHLKRTKIGLIALGAFAPGALGTTASAFEVHHREQLYKETGSFLDNVQLNLAKASLFTGWTGVGELVATPADGINTVIDLARFPSQPIDTSSRQRYRHGKR